MALLTAWSQTSSFQDLGVGEKGRSSEGDRGQRESEKTEKPLLRKLEEETGVDSCPENCCTVAIVPFWTQPAVWIWQSRTEGIDFCFIW